MSIHFQASRLSRLPGQKFSESGGDLSPFENFTPLSARKARKPGSLALIPFNGVHISFRALLEQPGRVEMPNRMCHPLELIWDCVS